MSPLFFVHIPKTAGTSFRLGAEQFFGKSRIVYDYGKASSETSSLTQQTLYGKRPDVWAFGRGCEHQQAAMVGGHVSISRFVSLFGVEKTMTFLREPLQRMVSEYAHFVRHNGYQGSFRDFFTQPVSHNRQRSILHGVPPEAIGFLGLTERYPEGLELLNEHFAIQIPQRQDNQGRAGVAAVHEVSAEDEAEFWRINRQELSFYKHCKALFDTRMGLHRDGLPYAHAAMTEASTQHVSGWAWWAASDGASDSEDPIEVEILVNDERRAGLLATDLRPGLCRLLPPRGGYVGFHLPVKLKPDDRVQCRVASTGQCFPPRYRRVPKPEAVKQGVKS